MDWLMRLFGYKPVENSQRSESSNPRPEPEPEPEPKVDPYTAEYDDWEKKHDEWRQIKMCHCGYMVPIRGGISIMPSGNVCPECGHTDKWETKVVRYEWEYSHKKFNAIKKLFSFRVPICDWSFVAKEASRNERLVEWTEDHCKVGHEEV